MLNDAMSLQYLKRVLRWYINQLQAKYHNLKMVKVYGCFIAAMILVYGCEGIWFYGSDFGRTDPPTMPTLDTRPKTTTTPKVRSHCGLYFYCV